MTKFGMVAQVVEKSISKGHPRIHIPNVLEPTTSAETVPHRAIKFGTGKHVDYRSVFYGVSHVTFLRGRWPIVPNFWDPYLCESNEIWYDNTSWVVAFF